MEPEKDDRNTLAASTDALSSDRLTAPLPETESTRRMSKSQPTLSSQPKSTLGRDQTEENMIVPILQTMKQNTELEQEVFKLRGQLSCAEQEIYQLKELIEKPARDILDEYSQFRRTNANLKKEKQESEEEIKRLKQNRDTEFQQFQEEYAQAENKILELQQHIVNLEEDMKALSTPKMSDDMDANFTFTSTRLDHYQKDKEDRLFDEILESRQLLGKQRDELEQAAEKIKELEEEATKLKAKIEESDKTFWVGKGADEQSLLKRVDELERELKEKSELNVRNTSVLVHFMKKSNELQRILSEMGIPVDLEEAKNVSGIMSNLKDSQAKNRTLRRQIRQMAGHPGLDETSFNETPLEVVDKENESVASGRNEEPVQEAADRYSPENSVDMLRMMLQMQDDMVRHGLKLPDAPNLDLSKKLGESERSMLFDDFSQLENIVKLPEDPKEAVGVLNNSVYDVLQLSMNTTQDLRRVKYNLIELRTAMNEMFERLKSSAALFGEVITALEVSSPELADLIEQIKEMHLVWQNTAKDADAVHVAVNEAETSVVQLEKQLVVLDQSLMQTTFNLDATGALSMHNFSLLERSIRPISVLPDQKNEEILDLRTKLSTIIEESEAAKLARDTSVATVESLRRQVGELETQIDDLNQEKLHIDLVVQRLTREVETANQRVKQVDEESLTRMSTIQRQDEQIAGLYDENNQLKQDNAALMNTRDDLAEKCVTAQQELEKMRTETSARLKEMNQLKQNVTKEQSSIDELQRKLTDAVHMNEQQKHQWAAEKRNLQMALEDKDANCEELSRRYHEVEQMLNQQQKHKDDKANEKLELSMVQRSLGHKDRDAQTSLSMIEIAKVEKKLEQYKAAQMQLISYYKKLSHSVRSYLEQEDVPGTQEFSMSFIAAEYEHLCKSLVNEKKNDKKTQDEVNAVRKMVEEDGLSGTLNGQPQKFKCVHKESKETSFGVPMRQALHKFTIEAADIVENLRLLNNMCKNIDIIDLITDAKTHRDGLNKQLQLWREAINKENLPMCNTMEECIVMLRQSELARKELRDGLYEAQEELLAMRKSVPKDNTALRAHIEDELHKIHRTMTNSQMAVGRRLNTTVPPK